MAMKSLFFTLLVVLVSLTLKAQLLVGNEMPFVIGESTLAINGSISNASSWSWLPGSQLILINEGELVASEGWQISKLTLKGDFTLTGSLEINDQLSLERGIFSIPTSGYLQLNQAAGVQAEEQSYVEGAIHHQGTGEKYFPIGSNGVFAPVTLLNVRGTSETVVGLTTSDGDISAASLPDGVAEVSNQYWYLTSSNGFNGSRVELPLLASLDISDYTVLEAEDGFFQVRDLGAQLTDEGSAIVSTDIVFGPYILIGGITGGEEKLVIHNIISPDHVDGKNDRFHIENIEQHPQNVVILLDRNGTELCRMENFTNDVQDQSGCNLDELPSGSYICVVEFEGKRSTPAMITILK